MTKTGPSRNPDIMILKNDKIIDFVDGTDDGLRVVWRVICRGIHR